VVVKLSINDLNSAEHNQEPESLEPENLNGLDLIIKNNQNATKPNVVKKIVGPYKGIVIKGVGDVTTYTKTPSSPSDGGLFDFNFLGADSLPKHRIYIPLLHSHIPQSLLGSDLSNVPAAVAAMIPEFLAESSNIKSVPPGTTVWCNFLDRENFKDPIYLGPIDDKKGIPTDGSQVSTAAAGAAGGALSGFAGQGDPFGGASYRNPSGQVSYPSITGSWTGELPKNGFTATTATKEQLVAMARAQIGKKESPDGSNGGPDIDPFNGGRKEAWCMHGIAWCFRQIGAPLPADKIPYPGENGYNPASSISQYYGVQKWAEALSAWFQEPQVGDIVVYNTSNDPNLVNSNRHVGLVIGVDGDMMETVEFNWGGSCYSVKWDWRNQLFINKDGSKVKKYSILGYGRRPLPYSGVPGGQLIQEQSPSPANYKLNVTLEPGSPNKDVVDAAFSYVDGAGGQYEMRGSGVIETIFHKGQIVLPYTNSTYCSGATFTIAMKVINKRNLFANKTIEEVKRFQRIWYGFTNPDPSVVERQQGPALEMMGIGGQVSHSEALPGDFAQIWRTNNSGHSVVFLGWIEEGGKIIGFDYRSSQGKGVGSGVGNRKEYFSDSGKGSVVRSRLYFSRIKV
jgi:hypothetical protein